ncbi:MAG: MlaD family protein [Solirubrobacteraceae bacterium]
MKRRRRSLSPFAAGILLLLLLGLGTYMAFKKALPFRHHYTIHAAFRNANQIGKNNFVRIAGVNVGKVTGVRHAPNGQLGAIVDMQIDDRGLPIHTDATVKVRPRIFLEGNFFADLSPGSPSAPVLRDGGTIPVQQTAAPVQLDQILSVLDTSTRKDLQTLLGELGKGFAGRGAADFNKSISFQAPAFREGAIVSQALLGTQQHDLSNYISASGAVAQAIDSSPPDLKGLLTNFNTVAGALATQNQALSDSILELPRTLGVGVPALRALNAALPSLRKLSNELDPAVKSTLPVAIAGVPFSKQLRALVSPAELQGLIKQLTLAVPPLTQLNLQTPPLLSQVRYASQCQNSVILPWSQQTLQDQQFPAVGQIFQEFPKSLVGLGADSRAGDANGLWFRVLAATGNVAFPSGPGQLTLANLPVAGGNPQKPAGKPVFDENTPCETQQVPNLSSTPGVAPPGQVNAALPYGAKGQAMQDRSMKAAVSQEKAHLKQTGQTNLRVSSTPLTASQIPLLSAPKKAGP